MKAQVTNTKGKKLEEINLDDKVFNQDLNTELLTQYIHVYRSNQRQGTSSTKTRAEVRGGGRKPWRQKGTGRARHGSTRSPIWVHGGVAHGPKPKSWNLNLSKNLKKRAMQCALSLKAKEGKLLVVNEVKFDKPSTKDMKQLIQDLRVEGKTLFILDGNDTNVVKSASNLKNVSTTSSDMLNAFDVIAFDNLVFVKDALTKLEERVK